MTRATLGFLFDTSLTKVLLITKNRPEWQKGKINGLGGKCEGEEPSDVCVSREVSEEAGVKIPGEAWEYYAQINFGEWQVDIFAAVYEGETSDVRALTDEHIEWFDVHNLPENVMSNLRWLIPMGMDVLTNQNPPQVVIRYQ